MSLKLLLNRLEFIEKLKIKQNPKKELQTLNKQLLFKALMRRERALDRAMKDYCFYGIGFEAIKINDVFGRGEVMPLLKGKKNIGKNIKELYKANEGKAKPRPRKQIIAIAESASRRKPKGRGKK